MADWFDENDPAKQDWFAANAPTDTLPEVVATQQRDYASEIPSGAELTQIGRENTPAWTEAPSQAVSELIKSQIPHDLPSYLRSIGGPLTQGYESAKTFEGLTHGDVSGLPLVGRVPEIMAAEETPAGSKERYLTAMKTLMDVGMLAGAGTERPSPLRTEPLVPEPPPTQSLGPGTIAGDVSRALERRFTLQEPPPEPPLAPAPPIEDTLANIPKEPPVFNPELGPQTIPEFQMPLQTEGAQPMSPAQRNGQILERRQGILDRKKELEARAANGEQGLEPQLAAVQAELNDTRTNPVVHAPPVEERVQHGQFAKPGYTAVDTPTTEGGVPVAEPAPATPQLEIPVADRGYAGLEPPVPQAVSDEPHVSAIANRFTAERAAAGELGEIAPGESVNTMDLVHHGLKMSPEQVNASVSRVMQGGDVPINDVAALRGEEARLSQRSNELSRLARTSPEAQLAADNAFKDLTDFHNGPVAQAKRNWHHQGKLMQGEIPVDLSTLNGMREAWLKDTGRPPPAHIEPKLQQVADKLARAIDEERAAARNGGDAIEKATRGRKLPTAEEVRNNIAERMKVEPCIV